MDIIGVLGLLLAIGFMIYAAFRGYHVIPVTIVAALIAIITNNVDIWTGLSVNYATDMKNFVGNYLIMFFLGALLGQILSRSGAARMVGVTLARKFGAKNALLITVLTSTILAYGGVSVFVIVFAIFPIALFLFQQADLPRRLIPGVVMLGAGSYAMTALPGSPALTNVIPTSFLGTTVTAAPTIGLISALVMFLSGMYLFNLYANSLKKKGERFIAAANDNVAELTDEEYKKLPSFGLSVTPLAVTVGVILGERFLKIGLPAIFTVIIGLFAGIVVGYALHYKRISDFKETLSTSGTGSVNALMNTAAVVGLGGAVKGAPAFQSFVNFALSLNLPVIFTTAIAVNIIAGITGSSSAGITIFMNTFSEVFLARGIHPEVFHRIAAMGAGVLDSLPHAGPNVTFLMVAGLKYREGYPGIFLATCIVPFIGLITALILASFGLV
ncbi:MAG: citrate transporter [Firmicutes bacterium HGW-Firmicutes-19]|jgi:H+/gluconate symporter-like permease|nr:MAG: citrate transporter [Firmicutes bacterium HGW-Firmicutes-19]